VKTHNSDCKQHCYTAELMINTLFEEDYIALIQKEII